MSSRASLFRRTMLSATLTVAAATAIVLAPHTTANAADPAADFATAELSMIFPGVATITNDSAACTSNFVFLDDAGHAYLGQAAHCSGGPEASSSPDGCSAPSLPMGTKVLLGASGVEGKIAYSSWEAMQRVGETDAEACRFNDFSLVQIPDSALGKVNPSLPVFGGPTGLRTSEVQAGEEVLSYGASPLRGDLAFLSPKQGFSLGTSPGGWNHNVYTATPGVPGDSGSGYIDAEGRAFGVLSTIQFAPLPASNGVSDLGMALEYAQKHSGIKGLELAEGTEAFTPGALPALGGLTGFVTAPAGR